MVTADTTEIIIQSSIPSNIGLNPTCFKLSHDKPEPIRNNVYIIPYLAMLTVCAYISFPCGM